MYTYYNRMEKFLLIFWVVLLSTIVQGLSTKNGGTEILVKDFIDAQIQQRGNEYSKRNIYTAVSEEIANVGGNDDKDAFVNGIRSFLKAKRLRHANLRIVKRSSGGEEDLHARGVNKTTDAPIIRPIPQLLPAVTTAATAIATVSAESASQPPPVTTIPLPTIKWPQINFCKWLFFICKSNHKKGWLFNRISLK